MLHRVRVALIATAFVFVAPLTAAAEVTEQLQLPSFAAIDAVGTMTMEVRVGDSQSVQLIRDESIAPQVEVWDGVLVVRSPSTPRADGMVRLLITVPRLRGVIFDGIWGHLTVAQVNSDRFGLTLRSSTDATISGTCDHGQFIIIGAPQLNAAALACQDINVEISGSGRASVRASRQSTVRVRGSGEVELYGSGEIVADRSTRRKITVRPD